MCLQANTLRYPRCPSTNMWPRENQCYSHPNCDYHVVSNTLQLSIKINELSRTHTNYLDIYRMLSQRLNNHLINEIEIKNLGFRNSINVLNIFSLFLLGKMVSKNRGIGSKLTENYVMLSLTSKQYVNISKCDTDFIENQKQYEY